MFIDIQSGYLLIGLQDNKQILSNPRTIGDFENVFIRLYLVKMIWLKVFYQDLHLKSNRDKKFFQFKMEHLI